MSLPSYKSYKQTQSAWLTRIPEHWDMGQSRRRFRLRNEQAMEEDEQLTASQKYGVIKQADFIEAEGRRVVEVIKGQEILKHVEPGDFVISMRSFQGGLEYSRVRGSISSAYVMLAPVKQVRPEFFSWLFKSQPYIQALQSTSNLVRDGQALRFSNFAQVDIPIIPESEQLAIANFLDRETTKIDALIAEQERLIELLQEKRQAVISHAVTKGLNPDAPMKDSGVEWLGEVPEHWSILPVWMLFQLGRGRVISHKDIAENPGDYPVYSSQTEDNGEMGRIRTFDFEGDYLTWTTDGANAGSVFRREGRFNCTNVCGTLMPKLSTHTNLDFALASLRLATRAFVRMDINPKLMNNVMASIRIPVPPIAEQSEIIQSLNRQIRGFEPLADSIGSQLCLLKERRSALISAAVTGQIDVRGLVPQETAT